MGKGSRSRPRCISQAEWSDRWDQIFGPKGELTEETRQLLDWLDAPETEDDHDEQKHSHRDKKP